MNNMKQKRILAFLLAIMMIFSLLSVNISFAADGDINYLYYDEADKAMKTGTKSAGEYSQLSSNIWGTTDTTTWIYANANKTISKRAAAYGDVHLIIADGVTISFTYGITIPQNSSLSIYAQSEGDTMGKLVAESPYYCAAIGGGTFGSAGKLEGTATPGSITINGGNITVTGAAQGAGIGGGEGGSGGTITINGGVVTAKGGAYGAGIGGGKGGSGGTITINGGIVNATGGEYNGTNGGSGLGASYDGSGGNIIVTGGVVTATGGVGTAGVKGSLSTGENGNGVLFASSISDMGNASEWSGIIFDGKSGKVYGEYVVLDTSFELSNGYTLIIPSGTVFTIAEGTELSNSGKIVIEYGAKIISNGNLVNKGTLAKDGVFTGNLNGNEVAHTEHVYDENGICNICDAYKPAQLITDENDEYNNFYKIESYGEFMWFAEFVSKGNKSANAMLGADIDLSEVKEYTPIGQTNSYHEANATVGDTGFSGIFDGCGHVIKNLSVTGKNGNDILSYGIFGTVSGTIKKLCVDNFSFNVGTADCRAGAVAGQVLAGGEISDCYVINSSVLRQ